jgi:queuine tRNA-ribosyltransferase
MSSFKTEIIKKSSVNAARVTKINTAHGEVLTPAFMPVGTRAMVNQLTPFDLQETHSQIILGGNTYHMLCQPGLEIIEKIGGMHKFMGWSGPMLTDSGGFQVFSLSKEGKKICTIDADGAHFKHPITGKIVDLTPTSSIEAQKIIGADIIMAFDECTPENGGKDAAVAAMQRTHRWLSISKEVHNKNPNSAYGYFQALFGIIQGGSFHDLREESARFIVAQDLDGIGIGGEVIGFDIVKTCEILDWLRPELPENKTRYTMGVGLHPQDLIDVVAHGADIFDCVAPTRNARHGALYCGEIILENNWVTFKNTEERGRILIKKSCYAQDEKPIMPGCDCYTCRNFTRSYLHYLFRSDLGLYNNLASIHNIHVMQAVCSKMREAVLAI